MFLFYLFAAALVFLSYKSLRGGIAYLKFFERESAKPLPNYMPFVSIIAPCRGIDEGLRENLKALLAQDFPAYEILFVVDSESDKAFRIIEKLGREKVKTKLVVAGKAKSEGQKVHNLREAVLHASDESEIFVFVDSDARPNADWLSYLIAPLSDKKIGAATGYRWFISEKSSFASELRAVWNASIASALGANVKSNFCWGGSTAIRRATFEKLNLREKWRGTLSDDFTLTRAMKEVGLAIYFVPQALTASIENCDFSELLEFTTRQMKITRVYAAHLWKQSFFGSFLFNLVFVWGIFVIILQPPDSFAFWFAIVSLVLISAFSTGKAWFRLKAVKFILKDYEQALNRQSFAQNTLWLFAPAIFLYNSAAALLSRRILWRGVAYEMKSHEQTLIIRDDTTRI